MLAVRRGTSDPLRGAAGPDAVRTVAMARQGQGVASRSASSSRSRSASASRSRSASGRHGAAPIEAHRPVSCALKRTPPGACSRPTEHSPQVCCGSLPSRGTARPAARVALPAAEDRAARPAAVSGSARGKIDGDKTFGSPKSESARSGRRSSTSGRDQFAPAQFTDMSDAEKLSRPLLRVARSRRRGARRRRAEDRLHAV